MNNKNKKLTKTILILMSISVLIVIGLVVHIFLFPNQNNNLEDGSPFLVFGIIFGSVGVLGLINKEIVDVRSLNPRQRIFTAFVDRIFGYDEKLNFSLIGNRNVGGVKGFLSSIFSVIIGIISLLIGVKAYQSTSAIFSENNLINNGLYANPLFHIYISIFLMCFFGFMAIGVFFINTRNSPNKIGAFFLKLFFILISVLAVLFFFIRTGCYVKDFDSQPISDQMQILQVTKKIKEDISNVEYKNTKQSCQSTQIGGPRDFLARDSNGKLRMFSIPIYIADRLKVGQYISIDFYKNMNLMIKMKVFGR